METDRAITAEQSINPDKIIDELGGCGKYQVRMTVIVHLMKTVFCFSSSNLLISTVTPEWWCDDYNNKMSCSTRNNTSCTGFSYKDNPTTLVSEFNLVCDKDFIPSTINSLQLAGQLTGNLAAGQLADTFGRKRPFFAAIVLLLTLHVIGFCSVSWEMFAISTFFTGVAAGFYYTIQYNLLSEFTLAQWRGLVVGFPSWPIQECLFTLIAWLLHDWRYLQLFTAISAVPCLLAWCFIPESFRWYVAHDKLEQAKRIIKSIAKYNKRELVIPETSLLMQDPDTTSRKYTFIHLFKTSALVKVTLLSMVNWFALGIVGYGIYFGIQKLSGNLYLNMFLFSLFGIPSKSIAICLQNRIGRRYTTVLCYAVVAVAGFTVGIFQTLDAPHKNLVTNILTIIANAGISAAWASVQTMTVELYPTVIRNIGFGTMGTVGGFASVIGPQLVYLESFFSGLLYYVCGIVAFLCVFTTMSLPETRDSKLQDRIVKAARLGCTSGTDTEEVNE